MDLTVSNNNPLNPLSLDLTNFVKVSDDSMDPANPSFTNKVISHSLLREGGVLALTDLKNKELVFPLLLNAASSSGVAQLLIELNQILDSPGATCSWQDDGLSQPTVFDLIGGQFDVEYNYRKAQRAYISGKLRLFAQPLGRAASPRAYAAASAVGPLLMISPYASGGALAIGASTQAGVAGFGGRPQGASSGVFYQGAPSLAGDAPALLQISYVGPLPNGASSTGVTPTAAVALLPDANYNPLLTGPQITFQLASVRRSGVGAVASSYVQLPAAADTMTDLLSFPAPGAAPTHWAGRHRLLAIARASGAGGPVNATLQLQEGPLTGAGGPVTAVTPANLDWGLYDLGTFGLRASEAPVGAPVVKAVVSAGGSAALDVSALVMLPDNSTWFFDPQAVPVAEYGLPPALASQFGGPAGYWSNTIVLDDVLGDQLLFAGQSQSFAPPPGVSAGSSSPIAAFSRGLVPRPEPRGGLPVIAVVGVGQALDQPLSYPADQESVQSGPVGPSTGADNAGTGTVAWVNPATVTALDGNYAHATLAAGQVSHYLEATGFGFNIPSAATITGIQVQVTRHKTGYVVDDAVRLIAAGVVQSESGLGGAPWMSVDQVVSYGGPGSLWGGSWQPSDINNSGFGFALAAAGLNSGGTAYVDYVTITVYYTVGSPGAYYGASQPNPQNLLTCAQVSVMERTRYVLP